MRTSLADTRCNLSHAAASNPQDHITRRRDIMSTVADNLVVLGGKRETTGAMTAHHTKMGERIAALGELLIQYGLVLVLGWIGAMKFTAYEAAGIQPLVANSPLLSWAYQVLSVQAFSNVLGVTEIAVAVMIALRPLSARVAALGSGIAVMMFLTTLSFLFSTPGWEPSLGGFPALSVVPGQFVLKDMVLLGVAVWLLGESLKDIS
jgi:uncharacterized membrane protein YkgB